MLMERETMIKKVKTSYAQENTILAEAVYNSQGKLLYSKGTPISIFNRTEMHMEGITSIRIYDRLLDYQLQEIIRPEIQKKMTVQLRHLVRIRGRSEKESQEFELYEVRSMMSSVVEDFLKEEAVMEKLVSMKTAYEYLYQHSVGVMINAMLLGTSLGLPKNQLEILGRAAIFHDIGMLFIPLEIMEKPKLSEEEFEIIRSHPKKSYCFLHEKASLGKEALIAILEHHERWDGSGYPKGKKGKETDEKAQIIGLADTFDSMINDRSYRKAYPIPEVYEYIMSQSGLQFNPKLVQEFIQNINPYPINTLAELNDGSSGVVIKTNTPFHTRPVLKIINGPMKGKQIDLLTNRNLMISRTLKDPGEASFLKHFEK